MNNYLVSEIFDKQSLKEVEKLLVQEGISFDKNIDYTVGIYDNDELIATGSSFKNTLRCFAVSKFHQGEGLLNSIISKLIEHQYQNGNSEIFLYTKCENVKFFCDFGFNEIARVDNKVVFMEKSSRGFNRYLQELEETKIEGKKIGSIVMNCNPCTLGHVGLIEYASSQCDVVHLFILSEDASVFPSDVRFKLVKEATKHLNNIIYHQTESYLISNATFPSYFLKDEEVVTRSHCLIDVQVFKKIAQRLNINMRFVGEEPFSEITRIYNEVMSQQFQDSNISLVIIKRFSNEEGIISASKVRELIKESKVEETKKYLPLSTYEFLKTDLGQEIIEKIKNN
ncbi:MAG: [citrate (pro-3S)-lyase] ligase [Bacilli bacterium]